MQPHADDLPYYFVPLVLPELPEPLLGLGLVLLELLGVLLEPLELLGLVLLELPELLGLVLVSLLLVPLEPLVPDEPDEGLVDEEELDEGLLEVVSELLDPDVPDVL
jgi:hypothetical protein